MRGQNRDGIWGEERRRVNPEACERRRKPSFQQCSLVRSRQTPANNANTAFQLFYFCIFLVVAVAVTGAAAAEEDGLKCEVDGHAASDIARGILDHNHSRRNHGRLVSAFIYLFMTLGYLCLTTWLAILIGWLWQPFTTLLRKIKKVKNVSHTMMCLLNTGVWEAVLLVIVLIVTAGGLPGWMILGFIFTVTSLSIVVVALCVNRESRRVKASALQTVHVEGADVENAGAASPGTPTKALRTKWTEHPQPIGKRQVHISLGLVLVMLMFLILVIILFFTWSPSGYRVWHHEKRCEVIELIPRNTGRALQLMYSWDRLAGNLRAGVYAKIATSYCGSSFTQELKTEEEKRLSIFEPFVNRYEIDMSAYVPSKWQDYQSVNEWFIRKIDLTNYRKLNKTMGNHQIVAPADSRLLIFPNVDSSKLWIKGSSFYVHELLNTEENSDLHKTFKDGVVVIARLAPQDYHRFHTPVDNARIVSISSVEGSYWSVNPDAVVSANNAFYNMRQIFVLENSKVGKVAYVAIGATCVGSVVVGRQVGDIVHLGDELGYMQFGGSTVLMMFEKGKVEFLDEILKHSSMPVETYVTMNTHIGMPAV